MKTISRVANPCPHFFFTCFDLDGVRVSARYEGDINARQIVVRDGHSGERLDEVATPEIVALVHASGSVETPLYV